MADRPSKGPQFPPGENPWQRSSKAAVPPPYSTTPPPTSPPPAASDDEKFPVALLAGGVAALIGGILWALLVAVTEREIKVVAIGVGALVGFAMSRVTPARNMKLGATAALMAALGLATGKLFSFEKAYLPLARAEMLEDESLLTLAFAADMLERETFSPDLQRQLDRYDLETDTLTDALGMKVLTEAQNRLNAAPPEERQRVVKSLLDSALARSSWGQQFAATLSLWDLLWFGAAIAAAWKIMGGDGG